ncbi:hypothetical protein N7481_006341 [Penicillium waksmanii]|uniref:uncharacterized protein n=1 Tax=Penicillium waksmanii TaxID=69791 RepID=UPI0025473661|nr:uncharacterized protein N7481_006341 [Penicillium waksmanii]KAJ5984242.1 hypothetical protein N7481_006341 [Penicillium waksmanii]
MGIFSHDDHSNTTCPMPKHLVADAPDNIVGDLTFHQFNMILSGACTGLTCLVIFTSMFNHAIHLSDPNKQTKIMRIASMFPIYSIFSLLSICFPDTYVYLNGWVKFFQGIAMYSFFMLLCDFLAPNDRHRVEFFASLRIPSRFDKSNTTDGLSWLKRSWFVVLQYPFVAFILAIAQCITEAQGTYCLESKDKHFAHFWINIIGILSLGVAIVAILGFYTNLKGYMKEHQPLLKLLAFKLVVGLEFLEQIIFTILHSTDALKPSDTLSYADTIIGLPTLLICLQMVPFAFLFYYAYSVKPYKTSNARVKHSSDSQQYLAVVDSETGGHYIKRYQGGPLGVFAWLALFNPVDFFRDIKSAFDMIHNARTGPSREAGMNMPGYRM